MRATHEQFYGNRYGFAPFKSMEERGHVSPGNMHRLNDLCRVEFAADPDICIREELPSGRFRNLVAVEIKGGRDYSNIHSRVGEAEKSHQKARKEGYVECWTIVGVAQLDMDSARRESPTTDRFCHIDQIVDSLSDEAADFRENILSRIGTRA
jgi:hypothetical protein